VRTKSDYKLVIRPQQRAQHQFAIGTCNSNISNHALGNMKQKRTETIERIKEIYGWLSVAIDALAYVWRLNIFKGV